MVEARIMKWPFTKNKRSKTKNTLKRGVRNTQLLGLVILALCVSPLWKTAQYQPEFIKLTRDKSIDAVQRIWPRDYINRPVTIVDIDEKSLAALGQWPWSRLRIADLVRALDELNAAAIGFDVLFPEYDRLSPAIIAEEIEGVDDAVRDQLRALPSNEDDLVKAIKEYGRVVVARAATEREGEPVYLGKTPPIGTANVNSRTFLHAFHAHQIIANLKEIEDAAAGHGLINPLPSPDGVTRYVPMFYNIVTKDEKVLTLPSLSAELLRIALGGRSYKIVGQRSQFGGGSPGIKEIQISTRPRITIPTVADGSVRVHYTQQGLGRYVSAVDVLNGDVDPSQITGKIILIGTSSQGLKDIRETPISVNTPGVEIHANIIEMALDQSLFRNAENTEPAASMLYTGPEAFLYEISVLIIAGLLIVWGVPRVGWAVGLLVLLVSIGGLVGASSYLYLEERYLIDASIASVCLTVLFVVLTFSNYIRESREKKQVRSAFGQYISPALVEKLAENPDQLTLGGEKKDMTLLFADVRGFTTISESFGKDAVGLTQLINRLLTPLTDEIMSYQGTIDKYMGDAIMAFWNAPLNDDKHYENACRAGLAMFASLDSLNAERKLEAEQSGDTFLPLNVGVGINSGPCVVGNMGSQQRFDYSVLGDTVNLASRLEGQSKTYGVHIVVGLETIKELPNRKGVLSLDLIAVKGKSEAVEISTLCALDEDIISSEFESLQAHHEDAIRLYREQEWDAAEAKLHECEAMLPDVMAHNSVDPRRFRCPDLSTLYDLYRERIAQYRIDPPEPDWDCVFRATSK